MGFLQHELDIKYAFVKMLTLSCILESRVIRAFTTEASYFANAFPSGCSLTSAESWFFWNR